MFLKNILFLLLCFYALNLKAHPLNLGYMEIDVDHQTSMIDTTLELNPSGLKSKNGFLETLGQSVWMVGARRCSWKKVQATLIADDQMRIKASAFCSENLAAKKLIMEMPFLNSTSDDFKIIGRIKNNNSENTFILSKGHNTITILTDTTSRSFATFISMGIEHIGATPSEWINTEGFHLPSGIDHILFVVLLIIAGGYGVEIFKMITGFTLGHSVTLFLSAFHLINTSPKYIEPLIALTIIYVSLIILFSKSNKHGSRIAFFFGLIHGCGFAAALLSLNLSTDQMQKALIGFNLGVELGQLSIVLAILPLMYLFKNIIPKKMPVAQATSLFIALLGCFWFYERTAVIMRAIY